MDKENQNKTDSREVECKLFYQQYYDLLRQWTVVKVGLENIITSNNRSIQIVAQYSRTRGKLSNWTTRK